MNEPWRRHDIGRRDALVLIGSLFAGAGATQGSIAKEPLKGPFSSTAIDFVLENEPRSAEFAYAYNLIGKRIPRLRALAKNEQGVAEILNWARGSGVDFAVRSGGHCFAGLSQHEDLVIDLRLMNNVTYDDSQGIVHCGAGATLGEVYDELAPYGCTIAGGDCRQVAIAGIVSGGGIGYFVRSEGLLSDQLVGVSFIDANGNLQRANDDENRDLFWAFQGGGGGSFGIITNVSLRVNRPGPLNVIDLQLLTQQNQAAEIIELWQQWAPTASRDTGLHLHATPNVGGGIVIKVVGIIGGPLENAASVLSEIMDVKRSILEKLILNGPIEHVMDRLYPAIQYPEIAFLSRSSFLNDQLDRNAIEELLEVLAKYADQGVRLKLEQLGGALADRPIEASAFPHRQASFLIQFATVVPDKQPEQGRPLAMDAFFKFMKPRITGGAYVNYADPDLDGWEDAYWGPNLKRLKSVKRRFDPMNVFSHAQSVSPRI